MESWMKRPPRKPPKAPPHVVFEVLMAHAQELEAAGEPDAALSYIRAYGPRAQVDDWGQPLPLSEDDADRLDGLVAILDSPIGRTRELMLSGLLEQAEVDAIMAVFPEAYANLIAEAQAELLDAGPPIEAWAEAVLSTLFGLPATQVFNQAPPEKPGDNQKPHGRMFPGSAGTQAERREISVREEHP